MLEEANLIFFHVITDVISKIKPIIENNYGNDANTIDDLLTDIKDIWLYKLKMSQGENNYKNRLLEENDNNTGIGNNNSGSNSGLLSNESDINKSVIATLLNNTNNSINTSSYLSKLSNATHSINPYTHPEITNNINSSNIESLLTKTKLNIPQFDGPNDDPKSKKSSLLMQASLAKKSKQAAPAATTVQLFKPTTSAIVAPIVPAISLSQPTTSSNELHNIAETVLKKRQAELVIVNTSPKRAPLRLRPSTIVESQTTTKTAPKSLLPTPISTQAAIEMEDNLDDVEIDEEECFNKTSSESSTDMENVILGIYKKVWKPKYKNISRDKEKQKDIDSYRNKMKFQLVNVVMFIDGVDYVLKSLDGELDTLE